MENEKGLNELEKALYVFSRIRESALEAIKECESKKVEYSITDEIKKNFDFSLDDVIDFLVPDTELKNYMKAMKKVEWPVAIKFFSQFLEGYLETRYSKEKTAEEVIKDFFKRKFLDYIKG
ncbi:MAG: hypothetical protein ACP5O8_04055 [Candidatus Aenigmatarchaeota archaeon]